MQGEKEPSPSLSPKSRAILFHFQACLKQNNLLLDTHIANIFLYRKDKFSRKQFHQLIRKYDQDLVLSEIDQVFNQLNVHGTSSISYETLSKVLKEDISHQDDPAFQLDHQGSRLSWELSRLSIPLQSRIQFQDPLLEFKQKLIKNENYLETIQLFITEKDGFLTKINIIELLTNLQIQSVKKADQILNILFEYKEKIQLKVLLQHLGLQSDGTRIRLSDYSLDESIILQANKSQLIKTLETSNIRHSLNDDYSRMMKQWTAEGDMHSGIYMIDKIPKILKPYFNYGSELEQPFAVLAEAVIKNNIIYIDQEGPTYAKAAKWIHISEKNPKYFLFQAAESVINRDRNGLGMLLEPKDIAQGRYGNCYFLSAVAAIVEYYPELVYRLFVLEKNPSHIFGVRLFIDGIWKTIVVDGCFPLTTDGKFCGSQPHHNEIWVMLLEKAWAKVFKSYENIHSGYNEEGLIAITGAPIQIILTKDKGFLYQIKEQFKKGSIITCTTSKNVSQISQAEQQKLGVFAGHAYTILRVCTFEHNQKNEILIKMKNPWGAKAWKGDWGFKSQKWTPELRQAFNYTIDSKDGTFFIEIKDFCKYFDHINISKLNLGYRNSYVQNLANRYSFYVNVVEIKERGTYYFTVYQDNGRKYKNSSGVYKKSPSWLFLAKVEQINQQGQIIKLKAVSGNSSGYQNSSVNADLEPGHYVLLSKVSWNYWQQHTYVLSSYGPTKLNIQAAQFCTTELLVQFIISWSGKILKQKPKTLTHYKDTKIWKCYHFDHNEGIGFIAVGNADTKIIQTSLNLQPCKGLQILAPFSNPVKMLVNPQHIVTSAFLVDPMGFSYKLIQTYRIFNK